MFDPMPSGAKNQGKSRKALLITVKPKVVLERMTVMKGSSWASLPLLWEDQIPQTVQISWNT
jgi:hypothetical protein